MYIDLLITKIAQMDAKIKDLTERVESLEKQDKKNRKHINASKQMIIQ
jgi:cell division septum initiation protein DivIVA